MREATSSGLRVLGVYAIANYGWGTEARSRKQADRPVERINTRQLKEKVVMR